MDRRAPIAILGDPIFWPIDGLPGAPELPVERLLAAVAGGLMVGWGAMLVWLGRGASASRALFVGGIRYEDVKAAADENGRSVAETLDGPRWSRRVAPSGPYPMR